MQVRQDNKLMKKKQMETKLNSFYRENLSHSVLTKQNLSKFVK